jgi:hypothetical protein
MPAWLRWESNLRPLAYFSGIFFKLARCGYTLYTNIIFTWVHNTNTEKKRHQIYLLDELNSRSYISFFRTDTESGKQPSVSLSQECSSLASSNIEPSGREDSGSMIPGPRSCAVSIASSIENLNITDHTPSPSLTGISSETAEHDRVSTSSIPSSKTSSESSLKKVVQLKVASESRAHDTEQPTVVAES